jgi:ABC-type multidrug transport system fused ATPase/permease subunit
MENPNGSRVNPYLWVAGLMAAPILVSATMNQYSVEAGQFTTNSKASLIQGLYEKTLRVRFEGTAEEDGQDDQNKVGRINNLMSSDMYKPLVRMPYCSEAIIGNHDIIRFLINTPLSIIISLIFLYKILGWSALVGFGCMCMTFPLPAMLLRRTRKLREDVMKRNDERIGLVGELLQNFRIVKLFAWERAMMSRVEEKREAELKVIWKGILDGFRR